MAYLEVDKSLYPVIILRLDDSEPTVELQQQHIHVLDTLLESPDQLVWLYDLRQAKAPNSIVRSSMTQWLEENNDLLKEKVKEVIFVHNNYLMTYLMEAIFLIKRPAVPYHVFPSFEKGLERAKKYQI